MNELGLWICGYIALLAITATAVTVFFCYKADKVNESISGISK